MNFRALLRRPAGLRRFRAGFRVMPLVMVLLLAALAPAAAAVPPGDPVPPRLFRTLLTPDHPVRQPEMLYVPIAPCRIADTHAVGGPIGVNGTRSFTVRGTTKFLEQGGRNGGCGIPASASSVVATVNALNSTLSQPNSGYLLGYPAGGTVPTANFMAFQKGGNSSNPTLTLKASGEPSLTIKSLGGTTNLAIDVSGYYLPQIEAFILGGNGTPSDPPFAYSGTTRVMSIVRNAVGDYTVSIDSDVSSCTPMVTPTNFGPGRYGDAQSIGGTAIQIRLWSLENGVEVAKEGNFSLTVSC